MYLNAVLIICCNSIVLFAPCYYCFVTAAHARALRDTVLYFAVAGNYKVQYLKQVDGGKRMASIRIESFASLMEKLCDQYTTMILPREVTEAPAVTGIGAVNTISGLHDSAASASAANMIRSASVGAGSVSGANSADV